MGDWAVKVSPLPVFCWLSYWNVTLPACWRSLLQAGGTACWQKERQSIRGRREGRGGPPQWDHNWSKTVGKQKTVLCWGHTHPSALQEASTSICPSIHSLVHLLINLAIFHQSINTYFYLSIHLLSLYPFSVYPFIYQSIHTHNVNTLINQFIPQSVHPSIYIYPSILIYTFCIHPFIHPFIFLFILFLYIYHPEVYLLIYYQSLLFPSIYLLLITTPWSQWWGQR